MTLLLAAITLLLAVIAFLLAILCVILSKGILIMPIDTTALSAAHDDIATGLDALAAAIRNPSTDNNSQAQVDAIAGRAEAAAAAIRGLVVEEDAEDAGPQPTPTPTPPEE